MAMKRTSLYLEEEHYRAIQEMAKERSVPAAHLIREACEVVMGASLLTSYDLATVERLRQVYPRMHFTVVAMLEDLQASNRESTAILVQIREALGATTTTTTTEKTVQEG